MSKLDDNFDIIYDTLSRQEVRKIKSLARRGDKDAQSLFGFFLETGINRVKQDFKQAVYWFRLAAKQGQENAQFCLGACYLGGRGVEEDAEQAVYWFRLAAKQGQEDAQDSLGLCYLSGLGVGEDHKEAVHWFRLATKQGNGPAQMHLGVCYRTGKGVEEDHKEAVHCFRLAAEQGQEGAQYCLGVSYLYGSGVEEDRKQAVHWFRLAAEQGHESAQYELGRCYAVGKGVEQDDKQAVQWCRLAAEQNNGPAQCLLGHFYVSGEGVEEDVEQGVQWFRLAAEQGQEDAQTILGLCYRGGLGVEEDEEQAIHWFRLAAEQGQEDARDILEEIKSNTNTSLTPISVETKIFTEIGREAILAQLGSIRNILGSDENFFELVHEVAKKPLFQQTISELIKIDETQEIEFKETFSVNTETSKKEDRIRRAALHEICGFLNSNDGVLIIGVRDQKNRKGNLPAVAGIEKDGFTGDIDKYSRQITDLVRTSLGVTAASFVMVSIDKFENKHVCRIECKKSNEPVYCNFKGKEETAVRIGTSTVIPPHKEWINWCETKF